MKNFNVYERLPKGFYDRGRDWLLSKRSILDTHTNIGDVNCCELIETAPLGFAETYKRGADTAGEKVFDFLDKSGRHLYLACDSTPGVLRYYLNTTPRGIFKRYAFVSPIYRYRGNKTRHFTQIGYTSINQPILDDGADFILAELCNNLVLLAENLGIKIKVYIADFGYLRKLCLQSGIKAVALSSLLKELLFANFSKREKIIERSFACSDGIEKFRKFIENDPEFISKLETLNKFKELLQKYTSAEVVIENSNLHSIETVNGIALRFTTADGDHLGDGGQYHSFGYRFDEKIKSLRSVATGVEALMRNSKGMNLFKHVKYISVIGIRGVTETFIIKAHECLVKQGFGVYSSGIVPKVGKEIKKISKSNVEGIAVLGPDEENKRAFTVRFLDGSHVPREKNFVLD